MEGKKEKNPFSLESCTSMARARGKKPFKLSLFLFLFVPSVIFHDYFLHYNVICGTVY